MQQCKKAINHVNSIHLTIKADCRVVAVDQLAGKTARDYKDRACDAVDNWTTVYAEFHEKEFQ